MVEFKDFKDMLNVVYLGLFASIISFGIPLLAITLGRGGEAQVNIELFELMGVLGLIGLILIFLLKIPELILSFFKSEKVFNKLGWIGTILHDPEKGLLTSIKQNDKPFFLFRWMRNPFLLFIWSVPVFALFSLFLLFRDSILTARQSITLQQIAPLAEGILAVEPQGLEIFLPLAFLGLIVTTIIYLAKRFKMPKPVMWIFIMLTPFLYGLLWMGVHKLAHGDSELALGFVYMFGVVSAYLVILTGSIIPAWVFKDMNNLFGHLGDTLQSNQQVLAVTLTVLFIWIAIAIVVTILIRNFSKKRRQEDG